MKTIKIDLDKLKKDHWTEEENKNVKLLIDFIQSLMNNHDYDYVRSTFGNQKYLQHNRGIADGFENCADPSDVSDQYNLFFFKSQKTFLFLFYIFFHAYL